MLPLYRLASVCKHARGDWYEIPRKWELSLAEALDFSPELFYDIKDTNNTKHTIKMFNGNALLVLLRMGRQDV
jgi:hypothetical protein